MTYERSIDVDAPPARVWAVMTDAARWPEWTPTVTHVELLDDGPLAVGRRARIEQPKLPPAVYTVTALEPGHRFTWTTGNAVVRGVAHHVVEPRGAGSRVTLSVRFGGLLGWLAGRMYRKLTLDYLDQEARGLKTRSEGSA